MPCGDTNTLETHTLPTPEDLRHAADLLEATDALIARLNGAPTPEALPSAGPSIEEALQRMFQEAADAGTPIPEHINFGDTPDLQEYANGDDADVESYPNRATEPAHDHSDQLESIRSHWLEHGVHLVQDYIDRHEDAHHCLESDTVELMSTLLDVASSLDLTRGETAIFLTYFMLTNQDDARIEGEAKGINNALEGAVLAAASFSDAYPKASRKTVNAIRQFPYVLAGDLLGSKEAAEEWFEAYQAELINDAAAELGLKVTEA